MEWFTSPSCPLTQKSTPLSLQIHPYKPRCGWYEVNAVCQELKCHFSYVPFHRPRRWPVTDHIYRTGLTSSYFRKLHVSLTGSPWHFLINFDLIHRGSNLSVKERWQSVRQVLTNCEWQISGMLQDVLSSFGLQFNSFDLKHSRSISMEARRFSCLVLKTDSDLLKCYDSLFWSRENGQSYNSIFPRYSLFVCSHFSPSHIIL